MRGTGGDKKKLTIVLLSFLVGEWLVMVIEMVDFGWILPRFLDSYQVNHVYIK